MDRYDRRSLRELRDDYLRQENTQSRDVILEDCSRENRIVQYDNPMDIVQEAIEKKSISKHGKDEIVVETYVGKIVKIDTISNYTTAIIIEKDDSSELLLLLQMKEYKGSPSTSISGLSEQHYLKLVGVLKSGDMVQASGELLHVNGERLLQVYTLNLLSERKWHVITSDLISGTRDHLTLRLELKLKSRVMGKLRSLLENYVEIDPSSISDIIHECSQSCPCGTVIKNRLSPNESGTLIRSWLLSEFKRAFVLQYGCLFINPGKQKDSITKRSRLPTIEENISFVETIVCNVCNFIQSDMDEINWSSEEKLPRSLITVTPFIVISVTKRLAELGVTVLDENISRRVIEEKITSKYTLPIFLVDFCDTRDSDFELWISNYCIAKGNISEIRINVELFCKLLYPYYLPLSTTN